MKISVICEDGCYPHRSNPTDAGADLVAKSLIMLEHSVRTLVPTGVKVAIPEGYVGLLIPRSSLSKQYITMTNSVGVIDSDYRGEIMASLMYKGPQDYFYLAAGDRIVQLVIVPIILAQFKEVTELNTTSRGVGGFGSTGV